VIDDVVIDVLETIDDLDPTHAFGGSPPVTWARTGK